MVTPSIADWRLVGYPRTRHGDGGPERVRYLKPPGLLARKAHRTFEDYRDAPYNLHDRSLRAARALRAQGRVWTLWLPVRDSAHAARVGRQDRDRGIDHLLRDSNRQSGHGVEAAVQVVVG